MTKVYRIEKKSVPKAVALRKKWKKFGNAADDGDGPNTAQTMVADEVYLQLTANQEVSTLSHCAASVLLYVNSQ